MNILVIEDELKTARALIKMISALRPESQVKGPIQKVSAAVTYLKEQPMPDLIFMDIQLADGLSFEIFKQVSFVSPVIFCTAFDEYALEAFKANGIDYILKPFTEESLRETFDKVDRLGQAFGGDNDPLSALFKMLEASKSRPGKQSFMVFHQNKYRMIETKNIAYFFVRNESTTIVTLENECYAIDQSLDDTAGQLEPAGFFRLNRQYLIAFSAIKEVEHYFARKLLIKLLVPTDEKLLVGKDKATLFLNWLGNR